MMVTQSPEETLNLAALREIEVTQAETPYRCCPCMRKNEKQFNILNDQGNLEFVMNEQKDRCCQRVGCLCARDYDIWLRKAPNTPPLYHIHVDRKCCTWFNCCQCCRPLVRVSEMSKKELGTISNDCHPCCCLTNFTIYDAAHERYLLDERLHLCARCLCCGSKARECCSIRCYTPANFTIRTPLHKKPVGVLEHEPGRSTEYDSYRVQYPEAATPKDKLLLLAAVIAVDEKLYSAPKTLKMRDRPVAVPSSV